MIQKLSRSKLFILPLAALLTIGCGGDSEDDDEDDDERGTGGTSATGGTGGMPAMACPDPNEAIDPTAMIDDLEDGDGMLPSRAGAEGGGWWTASDDTVGGTIVPVQTEISAELATPEALAEERCGSKMAMRVTGQGFTDWGAVMGFNFAWGIAPSGMEDSLPYDASDRTGIEFWARIGDTSTDQVRFQVSDSNSEPGGGVCVVDGGTGIGCYDSFGTDITALDTSWHRYKIPFSGLSQRNFGLPADGLVTTAIYQVTFNFLTASPFDFTVDDVSFY